MITVSADAPAVATYNQTFAVQATSSSGLPVTFSSGGACTNSGGSFTMTSGSGTCLVEFDQAGDGAYQAASQVVEVVVAQKAEQTIAFSALAGRTWGDPDFAIGATTSSGLPVSFAASGTCTVSGATVQITGSGSCTVTASQPGDTNFKVAASLPQTFAISKAKQSIEFGALPKKIYGASDFAIRATASSGLPVSFAAQGRCTTRGARVHLTGAGSCTLTASQHGNANVDAAADVSRRFSIARHPCNVPKVVGRSLAIAKRTLIREHCRLGRLVYVYSPRAKDLVRSQSRRPGKVLPAGAKIDLVVSRGPKS
jgi:hypothetical protein